MPGLRLTLRLAPIALALSLAPAIHAQEESGLMEQSPATEPEIVSILVYEAPGYRNIRTRTRYKDGEQTDTSASSSDPD